MPGCHRFLRRFHASLPNAGHNSSLHKLPDGRHLCWREYGDIQSGFPVIFFHGTLNSRFFSPVWAKTDEVSASAGARVIALDRHGYGESSHWPERTYRSTAQDIASLAAYLGLEKVAVLGYSSGGPNALVCAHELPQLVAVCGLISSDGPYTKMDPLVGEAIYGTDFSTMTPELAAERKERNANGMRESYHSMKDAARSELAVRDLDEALKQGYAGAVQDSMLETRDWGFELDGVDSVPVFLWHGTDDSDVPISAGKHLAANIASVQQAEFIDGENHTLIRRHWGNILQRTIGGASD